MTPIVLRRISRKGWTLTNCCWCDTPNGVPMVGSTYCKEQCPYHRGIIRVLFWRFVKCKYLN